MYDDIYRNSHNWGYVQENCKNIDGTRNYEKKSFCIKFTRIAADSPLTDLHCHKYPHYVRWYLPKFPQLRVQENCKNTDGTRHAIMRRKLFGLSSKALQTIQNYSHIKQIYIKQNYSQMFLSIFWNICRNYAHPDFHA